MARKPTDEVQLKLRFSESLRRRLEREAKREGRSMNSEIIHRLRRTFMIDDSGAATNMLDFLRRMGVSVTRANEADIATAFSGMFGRWMSQPNPDTSWIERAPPATAGGKDKDDGEKK